MNRLFLLFFILFILFFLSSQFSTSYESRYSIFDIAPDNAQAIFVWKDFGKYNEQFNNKQLVELFKNNNFKLFFNKHIFPLVISDDYQKLIDAYKVFYEKMPIFLKIKPNLSLIIIDDDRVNNNYEYIAVADIQSNGILNSYNIMHINKRFRMSNVYQNFKIYSDISDDFKKYFIFFENKLIIGSSEGIIKNCIDRYIQKKVNYRGSLNQKYSDDSLELYFDGNCDFICLLRDKYIKSLSKDFEFFPFLEKRDAGYLLGIRHSLAHDGGGLDIDFILRDKFSYQMLNTAKDKFNECNFRNNNLLFLWTNKFKFSDFITTVKDFTEDDVFGLNDAIEKYFDNNNEYKVDDILNAFGGEFCLLINGNSAIDAVDYSVGCLVAEVVDHGIVESFLKRLLSGVQTVDVKSGDLDIISLNLGGGLLHPSYCLKGKYLFIADNADLIEQAWNGYFSKFNKNNSSFGNREQFNDNFFIYSRLGDVINKLIPLLNLFTRESREWTSIISKKNRDFFQNVGIPLLTTLRNIENGSVRVATAPDVINLKMNYIYIKR